MSGRAEEVTEGRCGSAACSRSPGWPWSASGRRCRHPARPPAPVDVAVGAPPETTDAATHASRNARMTAATSTSPRRCSSWNSARSRRPRSGWMSTERRRALTRTSGASDRISSARPRRADWARRSHDSIDLRDEPGVPRRRSPIGAIRWPQHLLSENTDSSATTSAKRLVERGLVRRRGRHELVAQPVEQGVGRLVGDDVVRQAEERRLPLPCGRSRTSAPRRRASRRRWPPRRRGARSSAGGRGCPSPPAAPARTRSAAASA